MKVRECKDLIKFILDKVNEDSYLILDEYNASPMDCIDRLFKDFKDE